MHLPTSAAIFGRAFTARHALVVAGLTIAVHAWLPAVYGQAVYNEHNLSALIDQLPTPAAGSNGQRFTVPVNASAAMDYYSGHNTLSWFSSPPGNVNWQSVSTYDQSFERFAFRSADTTVRNAFISATDDNGSLSDAFTAKISVKEFTLDNVNLDPRGNVIALTGASHVWTMNNSSYNGELATPSFTATYPAHLHGLGLLDDRQLVGRDSVPHRPFRPRRKHVHDVSLRRHR